MSDVPDVTDFGDRLETLTDIAGVTAKRLRAQSHQLARMELAIAAFAIIAFAFYFTRTGVTA